MHEYINYELSFEVSVTPFNVCICRPQKNKRKEKEALATSSDSGSESEERSTDNDEPEGYVKQRKLGPELWHGVVLQKVEELPSAIDGMSAFELANIEKKELRNALKDGRKWKKNCPTKWKGHAKVRYTDCRGSYMCTNDNCPYKVHYGVINTTHFEKSGNQCKVCGSDGKYVPCHARRYISYGKRKVRVFHQGNHTCKPIVKTTRNVQKIKELVKNNPNIKPAEIQSTIVLSGFRNQMDWQTVEKEAASVVNRKQISNIKQKIRAETELHGHNFEAIVNFKEYCDEKDKLYAETPTSHHSYSKAVRQR